MDCCFPRLPVRGVLAVPLDANGTPILPPRGRGCKSQLQWRRCAVEPTADGWTRGACLKSSLRTGSRTCLPKKLVQFRALGGDAASDPVHFRHHGRSQGIVLTHGNVLASIGQSKARRSRTCATKSYIHPLRILHTLP